MRRLAVLAAASVAAFTGLVPVLAPVAEAQSLRRRGEETIILNVRPRSFLDAGNVVPVGSEQSPAGAYGQVRSYLNLPPYHNMKDRFGEGSLPDPVTNGPFVGASNPFGPIDYVAPPGFTR
jgi:hypothetical protein